MNKQEAIEKIEDLERLAILDKAISFEGEMIPKSKTLDIVRQINEPEKPVVPQFVADWIERSKAEKRNLRNALNNGGEKMRLWFLGQENYDIFARAWLDGYDVEQEKRYEVKLKNTDDYLVKTNNDDYHFYNNIYTQNRKHTRKELEDAGFGWVFDCEGIEIEEVTNE